MSTLIKIISNKMIFVITACLILIACNSESHKIKALTNKLTLVTNELETNVNYHSGGDYLNHMTKQFPNLLKPLIEEHDLCAIDHYENKGIVFVFSCQIDPKNKNFFNSDPKYNLIKVTNESTSNDLLSYEQFVDYGQQPIYLGNGWYYIEQNETFD